MHDWLIDNRLSLHLEKTEAINCGTNCKIKKKEGFEVKCKNPKVISETLSNNLETCNDWLIDNHLSLNLGKTEAMIVEQSVK